MSQTATPDIYGSINVSIMQSAAITHPSSLFQTRLAFRPSYASAYVAGLGCESFRDFFDLCAVGNPFVAEHVSEVGPACVKNGFRHAGFGESGGIHVAYRDVVKPLHEVGGKFVEEVGSLVGDLGVDRFDAPLLVRPLRRSKITFSLPVDALRVDNLSVAEGSETLQPKVNANRRFNCSRRGFNNIDREVDVPVPLAVLGERSISDLPFRKVAGEECAEGVSCKSEGIPFALDVSTLEWHPSERLLTAPAKERLLVLRPTLGVLLADCIDRSGVNAKFLATAGGEPVQVESGRPPLAPLQRLLLHVVAVVPDIVARLRLLVEQAVQRLYAVSVDLNHFCLFSHASTARRINSATDSPVFSDRVLSFSFIGSGR